MHTTSIPPRDDCHELPPVEVVPLFALRFYITYIPTPPSPPAHKWSWIVQKKIVSFARRATGAILAIKNTCLFFAPIRPFAPTAAQPFWRFLPRITIFINHIHHKTSTTHIINIYHTQPLHHTPTHASCARLEEPDKICNGPLPTKTTRHNL